MMALQLHRCGGCSHDAFLVVFKPHWKKYTERAYKLRPKAQTTDESLRLTLIDNESANGSNSKLAPAADRWKGIGPKNFVAAPRYSSLLKLTRRRRHELRMETRERVFMSISDWVFRRVKDPLVEIDPVTVNQVILSEKVADDGNSTSTVPTTSSPSLFGYLPPGFPKGADKAAIAAAIMLLLAALATWAILALRKKGNSGSVPVMASGPDGNGSVTNGGARQEMEGDRSADWQAPSVSDQAMRKPMVPVMTASLESQTAPLMPIPQYSTALAPSDLPLPPSFGANTKDKKNDSPPSGEFDSSPDDELVVPFVTLPSDEVADGVDRQPPAVEEEENAQEVTAVDDEQIISSNGVVKGENSPLEEVAADLETAASEEIAEELETAAIEEITAELETAAIEEIADQVETAAIEDISAKLETAAIEEIADLETAAMEEIASSPSLEELATETRGSENESVELGPGSVSEPVVSERLPSASESLEQTSSEEENEYILIGESDSLTPIGEFPGPANEPIAALPAKADVGVPVDSALVFNSSAAQPPSEEDLSFEKIDVISTSAQEEVPAIAVSTPFEQPQDGSDAGVVEERRKEYADAIEKVLPVVSIGAGVAALSSFSGVDGALQVVGALAAASFLKEYIWAGPRKQLFDEIRSIKSHEELKQFLKDKDIFPQSWSH
ncbi:unnamed protein product [Calypogeia fissa]